MGFMDVRNTISSALLNRDELGMHINVLKCIVELGPV